MLEAVYCIPPIKYATIVFVTITILGTSSLNGQILRVDKGAATADSSGYFSGKVGLDISINNRNSTADEQVVFTQARLKGDASFTSKKHIYYLIEDGRYYKSTGGPLQSAGYGHFRANLLRKHRLSYELFCQAQYDAGRNMDVRLLAGGGFKYRILDQLTFGMGAMQEHEKWEQLSSEEIVIKDITKMSSYITGKINLSELASISLTGFYQTGYDLDDEVWRNRVSLDSSLDVYLARKLDLTISYSLTYEDIPIIAINKSVYAFGTGVSYKL